MTGGGAPEDITSELLSIFVVDRVCKRYGWTFTQFDEEFERSPKTFGRLFELLNCEAEAKLDQQKDHNRSMRASDSKQRKQRLGLK